MNIYVRYILYCLALIPAFAFRDYTPSNELRYISIIDEALRDGSLFCFYNNGVVYADKPPLYFWLMMSLKSILGSHQMWAIGLLSILPAVGIVAIMDRWTKRFDGFQQTHTASIALLTTVMYIGSTLVLRMDILMIMFIILSLYSFDKLYRGVGSNRDKWLIPVYIFLALFTKGPMGVIIPFLSIFTFLAVKKEIKTFGKYFSYKQLLLFLGLCTAWFTMIYIEGGSEYLNNILFKQTVGRGIDSFHHKAPIYFYLRNMFHTFAPWSLFYITVFIIAIKHKMFVTDIEKLFASIILSSFIVLSIISSKIDIYLVPIYPFVVYLAFMMFENQKTTIYHKIFVIIPSTIFALLFPISLFATSLIPFEYESLLIPRAGLFILMCGSIAAIYFTVKRNDITKAIRYVSTSFITLVFIASFGLSQFNSFIGFENLAKRVAELSKGKDIENIHFYKFRGGENLGVFNGWSPKGHYSIDELPSKDKLELILIDKKDYNRDKALQEWADDLQPIDSVGEIVIFRK